MQGWLEAFENLGLVVRTGDNWILAGTPLPGAGDP